MLRKNFQGLYVESKPGVLVPAIFNLLDVRETAVEAAIEEAETGKLARIKGAADWALRKRVTVFSVLYAPPKGINGDEPHVQSYYRRASKGDLIALFRPLKWHEPPLQGKFKPITGKAAKLMNDLTFSAIRH